MTQTQGRDVTIIEVGPRDGLQNESRYVPWPQKVALIEGLIESGLPEIEVTSFVSPKSIPQLADNRDVLAHLPQKGPTLFSALVPNLNGLVQALETQIKKISIFTAASETFNQRNIRCSILESLERFKPVMALAKQNGLFVRGYISCVVGCPYEGEVLPSKVLEIAHQLLELGVNEISLGDTIGVATPKQTKALIETLTPSITPDKIAMHFHDTYGQAIANITQSLALGIRRFDSAVAGLGGCPYARGATGNVATEDVLYLMHGLGLKTGIDIFKVVEAGTKICEYLGRSNASKVANALQGKCLS